MVSRIVRNRLLAPFNQLCRYRSFGHAILWDRSGRSISFLQLQRIHLPPFAFPYLEARLSDDAISQRTRDSGNIDA